MKLTINWVGGGRVKYMYVFCRGYFQQPCIKWFVVKTNEQMNKTLDLRV